MPAEIERTSRFITANDRRREHVIYRLPEPWWSRRYEYAWAEQFAQPSDAVLDVACGICHPFKFRLAELAREVFACDSDPRILSEAAILQDIKECAGEDALGEFDRSLLARVRFSECDMTRMPYADRQFDKLFCISVFEHLDELDQLRSLLEFRRVLKDDGLIVATVDHPTVDIARLIRQMDATRLRFAGESSFSMPDNAIASSYWGAELKCIRLAIGKDI